MGGMNSHTLGIKEAADLMNVHPKTVEELIHVGIIPAAKIGRAWVMLTVDVLKHIENEIIRQTAARIGKPALSNTRTRRRGHVRLPPLQA